MIPDTVSQLLPRRDAGEVGALQPHMERSSVNKIVSETTALCTGTQAKLPEDTGDTPEAQEKQGDSGWIWERK